MKKKKTPNSHYQIILHTIYPPHRHTSPKSVTPHFALPSLSNHQLTLHMDFPLDGKHNTISHQLRASMRNCVTTEEIIIRVLQCKQAPIKIPQA